MRTSIFMLLVLSFALVPGTDSWKFWDKVKETVSNAADWVVEHCSVGIPPHISCKLSRRKRMAQQQGVVDETLAALNEECKKLNLPGNVQLREVVEAAYQQADANSDSELDLQESALFQELIMVLTYCTEQASSP